MRPEKPLPYSDEFASVDDYIDSFLRFYTTSETLQILAGGVHILDFFTSEPGLFYQVIPEEWQSFLVSCKPMHLLDFFVRDSLDTTPTVSGVGEPPETLVRFVKDLRRFALRRKFSPGARKLPPLTRSVALGMKVKKMHEVLHFASYLDELADDIQTTAGQGISHFVDFGSGQNYLGRTLASPPYNRHVIAVESQQHNIAGAQALDVLSGLAKTEKAMRSRKVYQQILDASTEPEKVPKKLRKRVTNPSLLASAAAVAEDEDLRPPRELRPEYLTGEGMGSMHYVEGNLEHGDLSAVLQIVREELPTEQVQDLSLMGISIHSCGNLSHYGIRSLVMNPSIRAVAIVGCCFNMMTEKLGPPASGAPWQRPSLRPLNRRLVAETERCDPQGYPLSEKLATYGVAGDGVRLNITARMMACQAPENWTPNETDGFLKRHHYRAVLQRIFLDKGVEARVHLGGDEKEPGGADATSDSPFISSTNPIVIVSLRKQAYQSFNAFVRGAIQKLTTAPEYSQYGAIIQDKIGDITDAEIAEYEERFEPRRRELSSGWSLMALVGTVTESLIVVDRWLFLKEHSDLVRDCWVEPVFNYKESPRNLVVVGLKR